MNKYNGFPHNKRNGNTEKKVSSDTFFRMLSAPADMLLKLMIFGLILLFVLYPMICIFIRSIQDDGGLSVSHYVSVFSNYRQNFINSLIVGAATALLCTFFSVCAAVFVFTRNTRLKTALMAVLLVSMVAPPFVSSLAYIQLYGRRGWITYRLLGLRWSPYNAFGVILMQSISFAPMNSLFLIGILSKIDSASLRAARDLGAGEKHVLLDVVLPLIKPGIYVSLLLSFVRSLSDFGTPIIIGGRFSTIASEIYLKIVGYSDLETASAMNMYLLLPSIAFFFLYRYLMKKTGLLTDTQKGVSEPVRFQLFSCGITGVLIACFAGLFFLMMILQYGCIFLSGFLKMRGGSYHFTTEYLKELLKYDLSTMGRSVLYALIVALAGTLFAILFAYFTEWRKLRGRGFFDCLVTLPYMLPGTCFGIGYILAFNKEPLKLTGTALIVIANMIFKQLPTSTKLCSAAFAQIPRAQESAVRDLGGGRFFVLKDVILPALGPAFFSSFSYNFSTAMTTAGAVLFLIDPGRKLAVFKLFDAVYSGEYAIASLISMLIILIVLLVEGAVYLMSWRKEPGLHRTPIH